jgi:hypothetical protein
LLALAKCNYVTTSFDLWVLIPAHNIFALVINFLGVVRYLKHIILRLFVATYIARQTLVRNLIKLLDKYDLRKKITTCVKDERSNLNNMTLTTLKSIVSDEAMISGKSFQGICFEHEFSKACPYVAANHEKNCLEIFVYQGNTKGFAKMCIIWLKTLGKGMCEFWSTPWKLNTLMKIRHLIFYSINFLFAFPFEVLAENII